MIFVTVGTHEQPFNRLIQYMDKLKEENIVMEDIVIQTGFSTYRPKHCTFNELYPYQEMIEKIKKARIVITHGGPSSFITPLQMGKIPIVVPRQKQFDEHVNDHQVDFSRAVVNKYRNIILIEEIEDLKKTIIDYNNIIEGMSNNLKSNNIVFNEKFNTLVMNLFKNSQ